MTSRELEVLLHLARSGGRSSLGQIAERIGISSAYGRLLCAALYARHCVDKQPGEVFVLTGTGQQEVEGRSGETAPPRAWRVSEKALDRGMVESVASTLTGAVQRALRRQLQRGDAGAPPAPIAIKTSFDELAPDATASLETNLENAPQEVEPDTGVRQQARALQALQGKRRP